MVLRQELWHADGQEMGDVNTMAHMSEEAKDQFWRGIKFQ